MRRFLFLLIILAASVFIGIRIAEDPGYALFAYKYWTVEMPLWFAVFSFLFIVFMLYLVLRFFDSIDTTWSRWRNWLWLRRKHKAYSKTNRGLIELIEASWKKAENDLMDGVSQSDAPLINFLGAAKAAHEQQAYEKRDNYLHKAYDLSPHFHVAVGLTQAQLQLDQGQLEQALATLTKLRSQAPKQPRVLKLLERVYIHLSDWDNVLKLTPYLYKAKLITTEQLTQLECKVYQELLLETSKTSSLVAARDLWYRVPKKASKNPNLIYCYAQQLLSHPDTQTEIEELIIKALKQTYHDNLVKLFGQIASPNSSKQLKYAEEWLKQYGHHAVLYLTLARLSMRCQVWGKAKNYFEQCIKLEALPEAYVEYGNLLLQLDESDAAMQVFREGLQRNIAI